MNLCRPDKLKSCAACCGLYNVPDAKRPTLLARLDERTRLFEAAPRTADSMDRFKETIREKEASPGLEPLIHVCEFAGLLDEERRIVGCMLHPTSPGNSGVDLRGLCHYGSMACKAFFCPAWSEIPEHRLHILIETLEDWYLYGLAITDVEFVEAIFGLLETRFGPIKDYGDLASGPALRILRKALSWKDAWPLAGSSPMRRSRYYFKKRPPAAERTPASHADRIIDCLEFTYGLQMDRGAAEEIILTEFQ